MSHLDSFLEETLEAWRDVREGIVDEVRNIPARHFDFRPTPQTKSVRELIQHILEVSMMMTGELTRADTDLKRLPWPDLLAEYAQEAYRTPSAISSWLRREQGGVYGIGYRRYVPSFELLDRQVSKKPAVRHHFGRSLRDPH